MHEAAYKKNISMHRAIDQTDTQVNDQVTEGGNPTMNEAKGEEQTESDNDRETNKPPDVNIPVGKDYTEAGEAKL